MQKHLSPKKLKKTIATILVFVMVFQFVPNIVIAVNMNAVINKAETKADATKSLEEHLEKESKERLSAFRWLLKTERRWQCRSYGAGCFLYGQINNLSGS